MGNSFRKLILTAFSLVILLAAGCAEEEFVPGEPKRIDDKLTQEDVDLFLTILNSLPDGKAPAFPTVYLPPPTWNSNRSLPVEELLLEAEKQFSERESLEWLASKCPQSKALKRSYRRNRFTNEEFAGLYLTIGVALSRDALAPGRDPEQLLQQGRKVLDELKKDNRVFSTLSEGARFLVQEQAAWMAVTRRCSWLKRVPEGNLELVRENRAKLKSRFPEEFLRNPLDEFARIIDDQGVPFRESPGRESDDHIPWRLDQALIGTDGPPVANPAPFPGIQGNGP